MLITVQFKIGGAPWEARSIYTSHTFTSRGPERNTQHANELARLIANMEGEQVRWNFAGLQQGHYVLPDGA